MSYCKFTKDILMYFLCNQRYIITVGVEGNMEPWANQHSTATGYIPFVAACERLIVDFDIGEITWYYLCFKEHHIFFYIVMWTKRSKFNI